MTEKRKLTSKDKPPEGHGSQEGSYGRLAEQIIEGPGLPETSEPANLAEVDGAKAYLASMGEAFAKFSPNEGSARVAHLGRLLWRIHATLPGPHAKEWINLLSHAITLITPGNDLTDQLVRDAKGLIVVLRKNPTRAHRFIRDLIISHRDLRKAAAFLNQLPQK